MSDHRDEELAWQERQATLCVPPNIISARDMLAAAQLEPAFLVKGLIPAGAITLMMGIPGAKKSWLAYSLALATARCAEWLGVPAVPPPGTSGAVLILNYDNPTPECGRRFMRLGMTPEDPIHFHSVTLDPMRLPEAAADIRAVAQHFNPSLVVVDSFRQAHDSDENSSSDMAKVMGCYKQLYASGAAVVIVHHAKKSLPGMAADARGSGEIKASADCEISVSYDEDAESDIALWSKHRQWEIKDTDASIEFELVDFGESTILKMR